MQRRSERVHEVDLGLGCIESRGAPHRERRRVDMVDDASRGVDRVQRAAVAGRHERPHEHRLALQPLPRRERRDARRAMREVEAHDHRRLAGEDGEAERTGIHQRRAV